MVTTNSVKGSNKSSTACFPDHNLGTLSGTNQFLIWFSSISSPAHSGRRYSVRASPRSTECCDGSQRGLSKSVISSTVVCTWTPHRPAGTRFATVHHARDLFGALLSAAVRELRVHLVGDRGRLCPVQRVDGNEGATF
jgi:hypothetical protein